MENARETWAMFCTMIISYMIIQLSQLWKYGIYIVPFALCSLVLSIIVSGKCGFFANFTIIMLCFMQAINWQNHADLSTDKFFYLLFSGVIEAVFVSFCSVNSISVLVTSRRASYWASFLLSAPLLVI